MARVVIVNLLLFLLPFALYVLYVWVARLTGNKGAKIDDAPIIWLLIAGAALVIGTVVYFISFENNPPGGVYHPPSFEDGKIRPGHIE